MKRSPCGNLLGSLAAKIQIPNHHMIFMSHRPTCSEHDILQMHTVHIMHTVHWSRIHGPARLDVHYGEELRRLNHYYTYCRGTQYWVTCCYTFTSDPPRTAFDFWNKTKPVFSNAQSTETSSSMTVTHGLLLGEL